MLQSPTGKFSSAYIPKITALIVGISIFIVYQISANLHHTDKFPHTDISGTAAGYPQYIIFRIATISGSTCLILSWFINHFIIKTIADQARFNIKVYHPNVILILGIMGSLGLMGSTANIDDGQRNQTWHMRCAQTFFLFTVLACILNSIIFVILYFGTKHIKKSSAYLKIILLILMIIQIYISATYGNQKNMLKSDIGNITQYSVAYTIMAYIYAIGIDGQNFILDYKLIEQ